MLASIPAFFRWLIYILIAFIVIIVLGMIIHAIGGGILTLHLGHFVFKLGVT